MASDGLLLGLPSPAFRDNIFCKVDLHTIYFGYFTFFFSFVKVNTLLVLTLQLSRHGRYLQLGCAQRKWLPLVAIGFESGFKVS